MIPFTNQAARQLSDLRDYYEALDRVEAIRNLVAAMEEASDVIERDRSGGLASQRPYPQLARQG